MRASSVQRSRLAVRVLKLSALGLVAWPLVAWAAARALIVSAELPHADAIVMLSGSSAYGERARRAAQLFAAGRAPKIILTDDGGRGGWSSAEQRNPSFVELAADELQRAGVPSDKIEMLPQLVASTYEEAALLRLYADAHGTRSLLFVTSAYHSRRALWTLRKVFRNSGREIGLAAVSPGEQSPAPLIWWLSASGWRMVAGEYVKFGYYWWQYRA